MFSFIQYLNSLKEFFVVKRSEKSSVLIQIRFRQVFASPFNLIICTLNCTTKTEGIQREKAALNSPWVQLKSVSFDLNFSVEERPEFYTPLQQTNKLTLTTSEHDHEFTYNYFPCHLLTEQGYSSYINHRWKWIILPERSLNVFKEKCKDSHRTWVRLPNQRRFFFKVYMRYFSLRAL